MPPWMVRHRLFDTPYVYERFLIIVWPHLTNIECDSLADGVHRRPRDGNTTCECKDGWGGVNCNGVLFVVFLASFEMSTASCQCSM
jgi:hypothetical protein